MIPREPWQLTARERLAKTIAAACKPDAKIWVDEWAQENRQLPADSPEAGKFRNDRTPYLIDIMRTMSPGSPWREGWLMGPHQVGKSVSGENLIGAWICAAAGNMLVVFPTLDDAKHLVWLRDEYGKRFVGGVVVHTGQVVTELADRIGAVPISASWK